MQTVQLKNGTEESPVLVMSVQLSLEKLLESQPIAFMKFVFLCRDRAHVLWDDTQQRLAVLGLVDSDGYIHDGVRSIVLSSVEGGDWGMQLVSPLV